MSDKDKNIQPKVEPIELGGYSLLNPTKLEKAFNSLPEDPSTAQILAQYDKLGGPVKLEGRKIAIGAFWDFANKVARKNVKIDDLEYEDEYVLTRKPKKEKVEGPSLKTRLAQVKKAEGQTTEDDEPSAGPSKKKEEAPEVEAPKEEAPKAEAEAPKPKAKKASKKAK